MDHYERLRVSRDAPLEVIRAAYRALAAKHHPDRHGQSEGANFDMASLNGAYEVLSDPEQRAQYDAQLRMNEAIAAGHAAQASSGDTRSGGAASGAPFDNVVNRDLADALSDIDWESLKSPPPVNPWMTKRRLVPLAALATLMVLGGIGWWVNDLARQMEAERAISAHLGQVAAAGADPSPAASPSPLTDPAPGTVPSALQAASMSASAEAPEVSRADLLAPTGAEAGLRDLGGGRRAHMLDGEPLLSLQLDVRPNPTLQLPTGGR